MRSLVKDLMTTPVVTVGPPTPFKELVARLTEHRVSAVPVVNDAGLVLGVVSEADLLLKQEHPDPDADLPLIWTKRRRAEHDKAAAAVTRDLRSILPLLIRAVHGVGGVVQVEDRLAYDIDRDAEWVLVSPWMHP